LGRLYITARELPGGRSRASARGAALVGDPGYYGRFGFRAFPGLWLGDVPTWFLQALPFDGSEPEGELIHHPAFGLDQRA
jgi:putative acetyltransferase